MSRVRVSVRPIIFVYHAKKTRVARMLFIFPWIRSPARYTIELETAEPTQLGGVTLRRRAINYDVSVCGVQGSEFKPHARNNIFFTFIVCDYQGLLLINPRNIFCDVNVVFSACLNAIVSVPYTSAGLTTVLCTFPLFHRSPPPLILLS